MNALTVAIENAEKTGLKLDLETIESSIHSIWAWAKASVDGQELDVKLSLSANAPHAPWVEFCVNEVYTSDRNRVWSFFNSKTDQSQRAHLTTIEVGGKRMYIISLLQNVEGKLKLKEVFSLDHLVMGKEHDPTTTALVKQVVCEEGRDWIPSYTPEELVVIQRVEGEQEARRKERRQAYEAKRIRMQKEKNEKKRAKSARQNEILQRPKTPAWAKIGGRELNGFLVTKDELQVLPVRSFAILDCEDGSFLHGRVSHQKGEKVLENGGTPVTLKKPRIKGVRFHDNAANGTIHVQMDDGGTLEVPHFPKGTKPAKLAEEYRGKHVAIGNQDTRGTIQVWLLGETGVLSLGQKLVVQ